MPKYSDNKSMISKKIYFLVPFSIIFVAFILFVCIKGKFFHEEIPVSGEVETAEEIIAEPEPVETICDGVVLYENASLWLLGRDEKLHAFVKMPVHSILQIVSYDGMPDKILSRTEKSEIENSYLHVIYNTVDFWILESLIAPDSVPAVIVNSTDVLKSGTLIALTEETKIENEITFCKIYYFDKERDSLVETFVEKDKITTNYDDIIVKEIIEKLKVTSRATARNELFAKAEKYNPSPAIKAELENQKSEKISYDYYEVLETMSKSSRYKVNLDELNTVDQSKDPFR